MITRQPKECFVTVKFSPLESDCGDVLGVRNAENWFGHFLDNILLTNSSSNDGPNKDSKIGKGDEDTDRSPSNEPDNG